MNIDFKALKVSAQPQVLAAVLKLNNEDTEMSFHDLEKLLKTDQNMAAWILKVANSPFYNRGNKIQTLKHAIGILGFKLVHSLCMVLTTKSIFAGGNYTRFKRFVWEHSVVTGIIARALAQKLGQKENAEEVFVGGLLHDIGKAILNAVDRKKFIEVLDLATGEEGQLFADAEQQVFGYDHMQVGLQAANEWNLPAIFHGPIAYHENLDGATDLDDDQKNLTYLVAYANFLANKLGYGHHNEKYDSIGAACESYLKVDDAVRNYFAMNYDQEIKKDDLYKSFFSMI